MMRYGVLGVVLVGLVAAITLAAPAPGGGMGGRMMGEGERPGMAPRMPMMGGDIAVAGGNVYVIADGKLVKLDSDLKEVASVDLAAPDMTSWMPPELTQSMMSRVPPGLTPEQMQDMMSGVRRVAGESMGRLMASMARLYADAGGVYVLFDGKVTVYSTDLKEIKSADVMPKREPEQPE